MLTAIAGLILMLLGLSVMVGWHTHNTLLIQIDPHYVPMQYNTAVAFMLSGLSMMMITFGALRLASACGIVVALLGALTLIEYLCGLDFAIDQRLITPYTTVMTSYPGRMAPNSALCFTLAGIAFLLPGLASGHRNTPIAIGVLGALVLGLSLVALSGYAMGIETAFGWGALTRMAIHTALGFNILGIGLLTLAWQEASRHESGLLHYFSAPIAISILTASVLLWQALQIGSGGSIYYENTYPNLLLAFGAILAAALAWTMNRAYAAKTQARAAEAARQALEADIAERKRAEAALKESEERFRSLFEQAAIGIAQISVEGRFLKINDGFCRIIGYSQQEVLAQGLTFQQLTFHEDLASDMTFKQKLLAGLIENYSVEKRYIRKDRSLAWVHLSTALVRDAEKKPLYFISAVQDITEHKNLQAEIERQARIDYLTGLANRRHFMELAEQELTRAMRYGSPLSIAMMDIDHFKRVNDTYGHKTGDVVLQKLSQLCQATLREVDIIGRIGGEEFAIILPETDGEKAAEVAERLRASIAKTEIPLETGLPLHFTVSIGIATLQGSDVNVDMLLNLADKALYEAKHSGRNRVRVAHF
jgi:diguanylate cyclase (GGDEF)-like protein/PAS domain S-box-containing protein